MNERNDSGHRIGDNMTISLHFTLSLEDGSVVDSTRDKRPAEFVYGDGNLPPGFERPITGLAAGESGRYEIPPEQAFGQYNPQNVQVLSPDDFGGDVPEPGTVMSFTDPNGGELPGVIKSIEGRRVEVDFNHPLAGRTLFFEVEVLDVRPATTH
ncbi:FKBP-type peptidyl-prolyl cis-trans isomerase [Kushneria phosphatilytica]|uniref:Peptidyl-prolyl cis-trans isomerase n=1 Tax=Kushneria phosphatilytica TaxID=657387 RepID=A0A1S1NWC0_9GAMM|nr:FKBP-type peptidyl-prolyl cis-trans isomerase [Kushneria phosphatilytica]OHV11494.1 peptidylprolyl isomerase [Kushneria phosphatilytica]QEL12091.1 FKBP-type peptidyl-prolyl cis-trans isomerase [Kushneria phosphatilytica]